MFLDLVLQRLFVLLLESFSSLTLLGFFTLLFDLQLFDLTSKRSYLLAVNLLFLRFEVLGFGQLL